MTSRRHAVALGTMLGAVPAVASAHSFGQVVTLPVPVWMYLYGASAALVLSFLMCAYFVREPRADTGPATDATRSTTSPGVRAGSRTRTTLQVLSVSGLWFCIATGLFGTSNSFANFNMTFFWIVFVLGFTYLCALLGDVYASLNPWNAMSLWIERLQPAAFAGRRAWPARWSYGPALLLYMGFIWIELFAHSGPPALSTMLLAYTALNLAGAWWFGRQAWFRYAEFFAVFLRLMAKVSILERQRDAAGRGSLQLRRLDGLLRDDRAEHLSLLLFVLFMLSSTAFDGLRETAPWIKLYWQDIHGWLKPWVGDNIVESYAILKPLYLAWQTLALLLSPFLYLGIYLLFIALVRHITRSTLGLRDLALRFAYTLLPITLVYHLTHYFTLLIVQGTQIFRLASDPFGWGWNLFGTARWLLQPIRIDANIVWHVQVGLILLGHIVSVALAHLEALRIFPDRRTATLSQLPMLLLMMAFTTFGLWILSLPISPGQGMR